MIHVVRHVLICLLLCIASSSLLAQDVQRLDNVELHAPRGIFRADTGEAYVIYAESMPGEEWGEKINNAIKKVREGADGGTVMLPPGHLELSTTIDFASNRSHVPTGVVLQGAGGAAATRLIWTGEPNKTMIHIPSPWHCQVRGVYLDANKIENITGIVFAAGWSKGWNTSRYLVLNDVIFRHCKIGLDIGDMYIPDLSQHIFQSLWFWQCETAVRVTGGNVANLWFYGVGMDGGVKTGFKLVGYGARKIRETSDDPMPTGGVDVLRDGQGNEIFMKDVPKLAIEQGQVGKFFGEDQGYYAGGGAPEVVVYGLEAATATTDAWIVDTNFAPIRIYSARCEGPGGLLKHTAKHGDMPYNVMLVDVSFIARGEESNGNIIEHHGKGPLTLVGCNLNGNVAVADTRVFANGVHFMRQGIGFTQLPGKSGAVIHQTQAMHHQTVHVPTGETSVRVMLEGVNKPRDLQYQILVTPKFRSGGFWVSDQQVNGFTVNFERPAPANASLDAVVTHEPILNSNKNYGSHFADKNFKKY